MPKMVILKGENGYALADKARVLESFYAYESQRAHKGTLATFFQRYIDPCSDLDIETFKEWLNPRQSDRKLKKEDEALLAMMMRSCDSIKLLKTINTLIQCPEDSDQKARAIKEARAVSECAKEIIIQEYLASLSNRVA